MDNLLKLNILDALVYKEANKKLVAYYNGIQNTELAATIDLFKLLEKDIRLYYGVFVDFLAWYGIIIDVNADGFSVYVNSDNEQYNSAGKDFLFDVIDGTYYIAHCYTTKNNHDLSNIPTNFRVQYNMYCAILRAMSWLNA